MEDDFYSHTHTEAVVMKRKKAFEFVYGNIFQPSISGQHDTHTPFAIPDYAECLGIDFLLCLLKDTILKDTLLKDIFLEDMYSIFQSMTRKMNANKLKLE